MAKTDLETLVVRLEAQMRSYEKEWARIRGVTDRQSKAIEMRAAKAAASVSKSMEGIVAGGAAAVAGGVGGVLGMSGGLAGILTGGRFITASAEAEKVVAQLDAVIRSTGGAAGYTAAELTTMAGDLQKVTTYGDEAIVSAEALLLTFTSIGRDVFPLALQAILDVSTAMGQDLKSSTVQIGKALNEPIKGLQALNRVGIQFSQSQKDQIKAMVEAGRTADAQRVILRELETQFGGSARAARDTLGGALTSLNNAFGDLFEVPTENTEEFRQELEKLIAIIQDPGFAAGFQGIGAWIFSQIADASKEMRDTYYDLRFIYDQMRAGNFGQALVNVTGTTSANDRGRRHTFEDRWNAVSTEADRPKTKLTVSGTARRGAPEREDDTAEKDEFDKASDRLKKRIALMNVEIETMGRSTAERERARAAAELWSAAEAAGLPVTDALKTKIDELSGRWGEAAAAAEAARERINRLNQISSEFGDTLGDAFKSAVIDGEKLDQILIRIANRLSSKAIDNMFDMLFAAPTGGGMSPFASLIKGFGFAQGGRVAGPGSSTSDSVPALLSNGEYVVRASQAGKHAALLEAINSGRVARLAAGGWVSPSAASVAAGGTPVINLNVQNNTGASVGVGEARRNPNGSYSLDMIVDMAAARMADQIGRGRGPMSKVVRRNSMLPG